MQILMVATLTTILMFIRMYLKVEKYFYDSYNNNYESLSL